MNLFAAARIRNWSRVNLVFDGNSLVFGEGIDNPLPKQVTAIAPISGATTATNLGISGQTTRQMDGLDGGSSSDVDSSFVAGKVNVLVLWEGTNSIFNTGSSSVQAINDLKTYIANRRAANPKWSIMVLTAIPRQTSRLISTQGDINNYNAILSDYNSQLIANYRSIGANAVVDLRQSGSPFAFTDYLPASFDARPDLWLEPQGTRVHLTNAGYGVVAQYIAAAWRRLPMRLAS